MPIATAIRFLSTPPNSVPMTSVLTKLRKYRFVAEIATACAVSRLSDETTAAVGCSRAISSARFGPDATAMRSGSTGRPCAITSLIRRPVPFSTPFIRLTTIVSGPRNGTIASRLERRVWLGVAHRVAQPGGRAEVPRKVDALEVVAVALHLVDLAREFRAPRPQHDIGAAVGEDLRERGP